ncbi:SDR family NAD(P)-dependent oxidoreductase [Bordetella bronchialis]|uniref:Short-chain dehydrogenase n=1 Tax=Bordetella bronchialis TaxID=463025 RepID=A0A193FKF2_9BORD|nr:SDR family NAD(P)-dependent oxidoreductase [Bordetella bronchialis]ANN67594.1 short-chain dehydrogenase [Bordetella bronchialis]ANN72686.1 short-chain dehydrogenase [Bordetella bronchialis]
MQTLPHTPRTALITGVSRSRGLGFAVATQLAELNHHVILTARDKSQAEQFAVQLRETGREATALRLDLADRSSIHEAVSHLARTIGHLDVLVNNASTMPDFNTRSVLEVDFDDVQSAFQVDVIGCWCLTQALLPLLRRAPAARIVNVSSGGARRIGSCKPGPVHSPAHSLAKYTLDALTATLATALADTPILVNAVDPGSVATHPERGDDADDLPPAEAAKGIVRAATLSADGPTGGIFRDDHPLRIISQ